MNLSNIQDFEKQGQASCEAYMEQVVYQCHRRDLSFERKKVVTEIPKE
jgi:hypothetical protein